MIVHVAPDPETGAISAVRAGGGAATELVIEPPALRLIHNTRGLLLEAFHPVGIETHLECYVCPDEGCRCPDDYYMEISIQISQDEYNRIRQEPGWVACDNDTKDDDDV